jgi:hypothetical protein
MANDIKKIALDYIGRGWNPVPVPFRAKKPIGDGWQKRVITAANLSKYINGEPMNIGVLMGVTSKGLCDVDLDCPEAIIIAPYVLPRTRAIFGRKSARNSHYLYYADLERIPITLKHSLRG